MALSALTVWEIRAAGNDGNGGGFVTGATGTDFSQQDAAQVAFNGTTVTGSTVGIGATVTIAGATPGPTWVGNLLQITGGVNFVTGAFQILSTAAGSITLDRNATTGAGSAMTGAMGGALASPGKAGSFGVAGNQFWLKGGTYTVTSATSNVANGCLTLPAISGTNIVTLRGYDVARGDFTGTRPKIVADSVITAFTLVTTAGNNYIDNIEFDGNLRTTSRGISAAVTASIANRVILKKFTNIAFSASNSSSRLQNSLVTLCTTQAAMQGGIPQFCVFDGNSISGCFPSSGMLVGCIFSNNSGGTTDGLILNNNDVLYCTAFNNGRHGFGFAGTVAQMAIDCISYGNGGDGFNASANNLAPTLFNCAAGSNTGVNFSTNFASTSLSNAIALTANPFVNSATGNFELNNTTGGGALLRGAGSVGAMMGGSTVAHHDIGAGQHADPTQPTVANVLNGVVYNDGASTGNFTIPLQSHVLNDQTYGVAGTSISGTLTMPLVNHVLNDQTYGIAGNGSTGTLTMPLASHVLNDQTYGVGGNGTTGTLTLPLVSHVMSDQTYGVGGNGTTGTLTLPSVTLVLTGSAYGVGGNGSTGTLTLPLASHVLNDQTYGVGGNGSTGTLTLPVVSHVLNDQIYGIAGNGSTGTLVSPNPNQVLLNVSFGIAGGLLGTVTLPSVNDVKLGVGYGPSLSLTGLAQIAAAPLLSDNAMYNRMAAVAKRLIERKGRALSLVRNATASADGTKPWRGTNASAAESAGGPKTLACKGVLLDYDTKDDTSDNVRRGTKYALIAARSSFDNNGLVDLRDFSKLIDGDQTWKIIDVQPLNPGDITILYRLGLER